MISYHNLCPQETKEGKFLYRTPKLEGIREGSWKKLQCPQHGELRFMTTSLEAELTVELLDAEGMVSIFFGDYRWKTMFLPKGRHTLAIRCPEELRKGMQKVPRRRYATDLIRVVFHTLDTRVLLCQEPVGARTCPAEAVPEKTLLAYGTSLTQGRGAESAELCYIAQAADKLNMDLLNLATAANAFCEPEIAQHIAHRRDWDVCVLEISVNMLNLGVDTDTYRMVASTFVETIHDAQPEKPIFCIGVFPFFMDYGFTTENRCPVSTPRAYRNALQEIADSFENVSYIDGRELLQDITGLQADLIHFGANAGIEVGKNLARRIQEVESNA